jgi:putative oxidoreductase
MKNVSSTGHGRNLLDVGLLVFRVFLGFAMITHGYPKLQMFLGSEKIEFMSFFGLSSIVSLGLAVFAEFVCSIFLILGLFTRPALIPLIITMLVAALAVNLEHGFGKMELALHYLFGYILLLISGAGKLSVDGMIQKRNSSDW